MAPGIVTLNADGTVTFTPAADYNGPVRFTYTVDDGHGGTATAGVGGTVTPVNDDPVATDDVANSVEGQPVTIDVLANDTDIDGDPLRVIAATTSDGSVAINADGTITFTPPPGFAGVAVVTYVVSDGHGGQATATVRIDTSAAADHVEIPTDEREFEVVDNSPQPNGLSVNGVVVDTVNSLNGLGGIAGSLDVDGVVIAAANGIKPLDGLARIDDRRRSSRIAAGRNSSPARGVPARDGLGAAEALGCEGGSPGSRCAMISAIR